MRAETYLNAYCRVRDTLEVSRLGSKRRRRYARLKRKLEVRLREACNEADVGGPDVTFKTAGELGMPGPWVVGGGVIEGVELPYDELRELYEKTNLERKALWVAVLLQLAAFLVLLGRMLRF